VGDGDEELSGAIVDDVVSGSPADRAGIGTDDVITSFAGKRVSSPASLRKLVLQATPGMTVRVTWVDPSAGRRSAAVRLVAGPPQ
jgi:S1-C subfamily serine protease